MINFSQNEYLTPESDKLHRYARSLTSDATRYIRCFQEMMENQQKETGFWTGFAANLGLISKEPTEEELKHAAIVQNRKNIRSLEQKLSRLEKECQECQQKLDSINSPDDLAPFEMPEPSKDSAEIHSDAESADEGSEAPEDTPPVEIAKPVVTVPKKPVIDLEKVKNLKKLVAKTKDNFDQEIQSAYEALNRDSEENSETDDNIFGAFVGISIEEHIAFLESLKEKVDRLEEEAIISQKTLKTSLESEKSEEVVPVEGTSTSASPKKAHSPSVIATVKVEKKKPAKPPSSNKRSIPLRSARYYPLNSNKSKIEVKQRHLALKELITHVKIALIKEIQYGHAVLYNNTKKSAEVDREKIKMMAKFSKEKQKVIQEQIDFFSIRNIIQKLEEQRAHDSGQHMSLVSIPRNVAEARQSLIEQYGLEDIFVPAPKKNQTENDSEACKKEIERIKSAVKESIFTDESLDITFRLHPLDEVALRYLKYEDKLKSLLLEIDLHQQRIEVLNKNRRLLEEVSAQTNTQVEKKLASVALIKNEQERVAVEKKLTQALEKKLYYEGRIEERRQIDKELNGDVYVLAVKKVFEKGIKSVAAYINQLTPENIPTLQWETTEWGRALNESQDEWKDTFRQAIAALYFDGKRLSTKISVLEKMIKELESAIEHNLFCYESGGNIRETREKWTNRKQSLESLLSEALKERDYTRIKIHEQFLQRIITCRGDQQIALNNNFEKINSSIKAIKNTEAEMKKCTNEMTREDRKDPNDLMRRLEHLNTLRNNLKSQRSELETFEQESEKIHKTINVLEKGFQTHIRIYKSLEKPEETFVDQLKGFMSLYVEKLMTLGISDSDYKMPYQFETDMEFASFGYSWKEEIKKFGKDYNKGNIADTLVKHIKEFVSFIDDYPEIAESMLVDITVTLSRFENESALRTLKKGIEGRAQFRSLVGKVGRTTHVRPKMTPEAYERAAKFKALADLARYAPMVHALTAAAEKGWHGFSTGGILSGLANAVVSFATNKTHTDLYTKAVKAIRSEDLTLCNALFGVVLGDSFQDIINEQRNLALLQLAGTVRQAMKDSNQVFHGVKVIFTDQLDAIQHAELHEKIVRIGAVIVAPPAIALAGMVACVTLIQLEGLVLGASVGIAGLVMAVSLPIMFLTFAQKFQPFSTTMAAVKRARAKEFFETHEGGKLKRALWQKTEEHIEFMRQRRLLPQKFVIDGPKRLPEKDKVLSESAIKKIIDEYVEKLNRQHETRKNNLSRGENQNDVEEIFINVVVKSGEEQEDKVPKLVEKALNAAENHLTENEKEELILAYADLIHQELIDRWLKPHLHTIIEKKMMKNILEHEDLEMFKQENKKKMKKSGRERKKHEMKVKEKLTETFSKHMIESSKQKNKIFLMFGYPEWTKKEVAHN